MTAEAESDVDAEVAPPAKRRWLPRVRLVIIGAAVVGLLLAIGVAAYFLLFATATQPGRDVNVVEATETFTFNLPTMTVNLSSGGQGEQFLKLSIALEVADEAMMLQIQPRMARVVDAFQVYLRELRKSDLEGSAGIYRLKEELLRRVNVAIFPAKVENILFREILIQ